MIYFTYLCVCKLLLYYYDAIMMQLRIKEICKSKGITLNDLAERVGVSRVSLSGIATGKQKPSFDTLERLSNALNITPAELFATPKEGTITCPHCGKPIQFAAPEKQKDEQEK